MFVPAVPEELKKSSHPLADLLFFFAVMMPVLLMPSQPLITQIPPEDLETLTLPLCNLLKAEQDYVSKQMTRKHVCAF